MGLMMSKPHGSSPEQISLLFLQHYDIITRLAKLSLFKLSSTFILTDTISVISCTSSFFYLKACNKSHQTIRLSQNACIFKTLKNKVARGILVFDAQVKDQ